MAGKTKWLAEMFHSFPHVDFDFQNTTTVFTPGDTRYQQALMFNGIIFFFVAIALFLGFTLYFLICSCYFCSNCFPTKITPRPARSRGLRLVVALFALLSCVALGVGFYGNNKTTDGVEEFSKNAVDIYDSWDLYKFKNTVITQFMQNGANKSINDLKSALEKYFIPIPVVVRDLEKLVTHTIEELGIADKKIKGSEVNLKSIADQALDKNKLRWWITIALHFWHLLLVLVVFYSAWRERRCPVAMFAVMGILSLLNMMGSVSVEVPLSVGAADICMKPKEAVEQNVQGTVEKEIVRYYVECFNKSGNPLFEPYYKLQNRFVMIKNTIHMVQKDPVITNLSSSLHIITTIYNSVIESEKDLEMLIRVMDCKYINGKFRAGVDAICFTVLNGLGLLILAALIITVFLISKLVCVTPIWKSMAKLKSILRRPVQGGVHLVTESYSGPPGGEENFLDSSWDTSLDASYKSIDEDQRGRDDNDIERVPLVTHDHQAPPTYAAVHGDTEFLSVEEDRRRHQAETET